MMMVQFFKVSEPGPFSIEGVCSEGYFNEIIKNINYYLRVHT
jgi:hypothetical protein